MVRVLARVVVGLGEVTGAGIGAGSRLSFFLDPAAAVTVTVCTFVEMSVKVAVVVDVATVVLSVVVATVVVEVCAEAVEVDVEVGIG